jgi:hypothetical protein
MLSTAKRYAITAKSLNPGCAHVTDLLEALGNVRTSAKWPSRFISGTKLLLKYGDRILGVDSSCDMAQKLSAAASSLDVQAGSVFPNCLPSGKLLDTCVWNFHMETRLDKKMRTGWPDVCYWTLSSGRLNFAGRTVRFLC